MATTTNYGWTTPDDTALVKDGAAAIRSLGTAIDTTTYNNAQAAIAKTIVDAKGDLIVGSASDAVARLAVGTNDYVLTADSSATNGLKWAAPAGGGADLLATLSLTSGSSVSSGTISSSYRQFWIYVEAMKLVSGLEFINLRLNGDTGSNYSWTAWDQPNAANTINSGTVDAQTSYRIGKTGDTNVGTRNFSSVITIQKPSSTSRIYIESKATGFDGGNYYPHNCWGLYGASAAITSITLFTAGTFSAGTAYVYGVN